MIVVITEEDKEKQRDITLSKVGLSSSKKIILFASIKAI